MLRRLLIVALLLIASPAYAKDLAGLWALRSGDTVLMLFELRRTARGWSAEWQRPYRFDSDEDGISRVIGPISTRTATNVYEVEGGVEMVFPSPGVSDPPDRILVRAYDDETAGAEYAEFGNEPAKLVRVADTRLRAAWESGKFYAKPVYRPDNPEMAEIFALDQALRSAAKIDWDAVDRQDAANRLRTQKLIDAGELRSGEDFYRAAFVFQHGDIPDDYLKAHALALIAAARGKTLATWIAAATFDRYLQSIGKPQIYGTQFNRDPKSGGMTQEPFRRDLLTDSLRKATRVPALSEQREQLRTYQKQGP